MDETPVLMETPGQAERDYPVVGFGFWIAMLVMTGISVFGGTVAGVISGLALGFLGIKSILPIGAAVTGIIIGFVQWIVLRLRIRYAAWWIVASTIGFSIGITVISPLVDASRIVYLHTLLGGAVFGSVPGALSGVGQWLVLRRQKSRSGWWIAVNSVAWAAGGAVMFGDPGIAAAGLAVGVATSSGLVWLLRQPAPSGSVVDVIARKLIPESLRHWSKSLKLGQKRALPVVVLILPLAFWVFIQFGLP